MKHSRFIKLYKNNSNVDNCFLCRRKLLKGRSNRNKDLYNTKEHIFPNQLLRKYSWNQTESHKPFIGHVDLSPKTKDSYSELKIPCCTYCNTHILNKTYEGITKRLLNIDYGSIDNQNVDLICDIFDWSAFIFYKVFYNEALIRSVENKFKRIYISNLWDIYVLILHKVGYLNLSIRTSSPGSVFVFKCKEARKNTKLNFDFVDNLHGGFLAARIGKIGFIVSLYDHGYLEYILGSSPLVQKIMNEKFNPLQFRSLVAFADYSLRRLRSMPNFMVKKERNKLVIDYLPFMMRRPIDYNWDDRLRVASEYIYDPMETYEFLTDDNGNFRKLGFNEGYGNIKSTVILQRK